MISGSIQSIGIRSVEVLIKVKFSEKGGKIQQQFFIESGRNSQALRDSRFSVYDKLENKIKELNLEGLYPQGFSFLERVDSEDKITLIYNILDKVELENYYFIIAGFIPKNTGCYYCEFNRNCVESQIPCEKKGKIIPKALRSCLFFRERNGLFVT